MKKIFKVFCICIVIFILIITSISIYNYCNTLNIPELKTSNMEYGGVTNERKIGENYEIYYLSYNSENEFLNTKINEYINSSIKTFIEENNTNDYVFQKDKAIFLQILDTYKVNDNIVGVKITTVKKKLKCDEYNTYISTFNCSITDNKDITLDELFNDGYKGKIVDIYSDTYVLTKENIIFFDRKK